MMKYRKKLGKGGELDLMTLFNALGNFADTPNGSDTQDPGAAIAAGSLKGAGFGAKLGSVVPGIGNIVGGAAGALGGGVIAAIQQKKIEENNRSLESKQREQNARAGNILNTARMRNYDTGTSYTSLYAKGGTLPFSPIGSGAIKVKGKKHEEGGVKLGNAEVEKGEVIHGRHVFSDRLKVPGSSSTFADAATKVAGSPMYKTLASNFTSLQKTAEDPRTNQYTAGTAARNLEKIINPLDRLFNIQETLKGGGPQKLRYALGGSLGNLGLVDPIDPLAIRNARGVLNKVGPTTSFAADAARNPIQSESISTPPLKTWGINNLAVEGVTKAADQIGKYRKQFPTYFRQFERNAPPASTLAPDVIKNEAKDRPDISFTGNDILNKIGDALPYADNITNALLTNNSPKVPAPRLDISPALKRKFNIQPQLAEIDRTGAAVKRSLRDNTTDGSALRASLISRNVQDMYAKNALLGQKENIETELGNKQAILDAETANKNIGTLNNFDLRKFTRNADIQTRVSQNAANFVEDASQQKIDRRLNANDELNTALVLKKYEKSGVLDRLQISKLRKLINSGMSAEDAIASLKK